MNSNSKGARPSSILSLFVFLLIVFQPSVYAEKIELTDRYLRGATPVFRPAMAQFDRDRYAPWDRIGVSLIDPSKNQDIKKIDRVDVLVSVWRHRDKERLTLIETGPNTSEFLNRNGLLLSSKSSKPGDGRLQATGGQVLELHYLDGDKPAGSNLDQSIVKGGRFGYLIDSNLKSHSATMAAHPSRPIAVVVNPGGWRDEFVSNELIVRTDDSETLKALVERYDGVVLQDGSVSTRGSVKRMNAVSMHIAKHDLSKPPTVSHDGSIGYALVRVDPSKADTRRIEQRMTERGLRGEFIFSSLQALQLSAIVIEQQALGRNAGFNTIMHLQRCPCADALEDEGNDAFSENWIRNLHLRVDLAWQFLDGIGLPDEAVAVSAGSPWITHWQGSDGSFPDWEPVRLAIMDKDFAPNDDWPEADIDNYDCISNGYTPVVGYRSTTPTCVGRRVWSPIDAAWHGTRVYGIAAALLDNQYGTAGSSGMCRGVPNTRIHPILSLLHEGFNLFEVALNLESMDSADVINLSFGGECNWFCQTFGISPYVLDNAVQTARQRGAIMVAGAGDEQLDIGHEYWWGNRKIIPCEIPGVICVGAVEQSSGHFTAVETGQFPSTRSWGSNFGVGVDIWSPTDIPTTSPSAEDSNFPPLTPHTLRTMSGTSASTAYVTGVMSMIKALYPPDQRSIFNHEAAINLLERTASRLGQDAKVDSHGGLINPFEMVRRQANDLGLALASVDPNESNDTRTNASSLTVLPGQNTTFQGILTPNDDQDWYRFYVADYWDFTADIDPLQTVDPAHVSISLHDRSGTLIMTGSPPLPSEQLEPGYYYLALQDDRNGGFDFNCYALATRADMADLEPDVFDDGDASTPPPGRWPTERNDQVEERTALNLTSDPQERGSRIGYDDLNFDTIEDIDFFQVQLPDNAGQGCFCPATQFGEPSRLVVSIRADQPVRLQLHRPAEDNHPWILWESFDPEDSGLSASWGSYIEMDLPCPDLAMVRRDNGSEVPLLTNERAIVFSVSTEGSRTEYEFNVDYTYRRCSASHDQDSAGHYRRFWGFDDTDEQTALIPAAQDRALWDCIGDPACDPSLKEAEGFYILEWEGGDLALYLRYSSPRSDGQVNAVLFDRKGDLLAKGRPISEKSPHSKSSVEAKKLNGALRLRVIDLPKGEYILRLEAPAPTSIVLGENLP